MIEEEAKQARPEMIGHCRKYAAERPLHGARSPQRVQEQLRLDCKHDESQHAKMSYRPPDHERVLDPNSASSGELPTDDPQVSQFERSSGLLARRNAEINSDRLRIEGVTICQD